MLSYLKKFCASAPAPFTAPPGVPTRAWARLVGSGRRHLDVAAPVGRRAGRCGLWSVACAVWLLAVGCGPAAVIGLPWPRGLWLAPAGWWPVVGRIAGLLAGGCAPALCLCWLRLSACALLGGYGGRIYQAPRRLYRARKTPPGAAGRLPGGLFSPSPRRGARGRRRSRHGPPVLPSAGSPVGGPLVLLSALASCLPVCWSCPPPRTAPRKTPEKTRRIFPASLLDLSRRRSRFRTRPGSTSPAAPVQIGTPEIMPEAAKIPADFSAEGFYARGIVSWKIYLYAPYSPPKQAKRRQIAQKPPRNFVQKKFPTPPFRGAGGKVFGGLTAARPSANIRDKPRPHGPGPANRRKASRREGRERDHAKHGRAAGERSQERGAAGDHGNGRKGQNH